MEPPASFEKNDFCDICRSFIPSFTDFAYGTGGLFVAEDVERITTGADDYPAAGRVPALCQERAKTAGKLF